MPSNTAFPIAPLRHPAARRYEADWARLRDDPGAVRHAAGWALVPDEITSLDDVLVAIGCDRPPSPAAADRLRQLVLLAAGDTLATQVVVRRLLPGALGVATRYRFQASDDTLGDLVAALWIAVRTFDPGRHPACLAAALLADADYRAFRSSARRAGREVPRAGFAEELAAPAAIADPAAELADLVDLAAAHGLADRDDVAFVRLLTAEPSSTRLAARLHVTPRTIRNRRARLAAKLRAAAALAA